MGPGFYSPNNTSGWFNTWVYGSSSQLWTLSIATGSFIQWFGAIPTAGWTGAVKIKSLWTPSGGTGGTGSHDYQLACTTPGTSNQTSAFSFGATVNKTFSFSSGPNNVGQLDSVTLNLPSGGCNAGDIAVIRMSRNVTGSDSDPSYVAYFDVSMPRVVQ